MRFGAHRLFHGNLLGLFQLRRFYYLFVTGVAGVSGAKNFCNCYRAWLLGGICAGFARVIARIKRLWPQATDYIIPSCEDPKTSHPKS